MVLDKVLSWGKETPIDRQSFSMEVELLLSTLWKMGLSA